MVNYDKGKIYALTCNVTGERYIGSTCKDYLSQRLAGHRDQYKRWKEGNDNFVSSFNILERGDYEMVLLEDYPCKSKDQLHSRERFWIEQGECINIHIPTRTNREYREDNKEHLKEKAKEYYVENREEIRDRAKQHYEVNKQVILEQQRRYYQANRDKILQKDKEHRGERKETLNERARQYHHKYRETILVKQKEYRETHKQEAKDYHAEYRQQRFQCECGSEVSKAHVADHKKTKKHQDFINQSSETTSSSNSL